MANEIRLTVQLQVKNGEFDDVFQFSDTLDQAAIGEGGGVVLVSHTAATTISVGSVTTMGWCTLKNLDPTNYVTYGPDSSGLVPFGRMKPGEPATFRLEPGITIKMLAHTADCKVQVKVYQD